MWLSAERMSPYRFYQAWIQTDDAELAKLLAQLTLLPLDEIERVCAEHAEAPHRRSGQQRLAWEVTALVHGPEAADAALEASSVVFGGGAVRGLDRAVLESLAAELPTALVDRALLRTEGNVVAVLKETGVTSSTSEAVRLLSQQGISVNDERVSGDRTLTESDLLHGEFLLIRTGQEAGLPGPGDTLKSHRCHEMSKFARRGVVGVRHPAYIYQSASERRASNTSPRHAGRARSASLQPDATAPPGCRGSKNLSFCVRRAVQFLENGRDEVRSVCGASR